MSEQLTKPSIIDHLSNPVAEWKNVSSERINDADKAHDMASEEDDFRTLIRKQGQAALNAINTGDDKEFRSQLGVMDSNLHNGPIAVERAGKDYDAKQKADLAERNSHRPEWVNVTDERIDDSVKAAYMASTENAWREQIDVTAQKAKAVSQLDNPLSSLAAQVITEPNRYDAMVNGPRAVEATAQAYDDLKNPNLPAAS